MNTTIHFYVNPVIYCSDCFFIKICILFNVYRWMVFASISIISNANIRTFLGTNKYLCSLFAIQSVHNVHLNFFYSKEIATILRGVLSLNEYKDDNCQHLISKTVFFIRGKEYIFQPLLNYFGDRDFMDTLYNTVHCAFSYCSFVLRSRTEMGVQPFRKVCKPVG